MRSLLMVVLALGLIGGAIAVPVDFSDNCTVGNAQGVYLSFDGVTFVDTVYGLEITSSCASGTGLQYDVPLNVTFGNVTDGDVIITPTSIYVDSVMRPDLDLPATLTFRGLNFITEPALEKDGVSCGVGEGCTNATFSQNTGTYVVSVAGFSNYSLTAKQDFVVYSDPQPELQNKVYQTIDMGNGNRSTEYKCLIQIYGRNEGGAYILVQTNPQRQVQAKMFGSPDPNQPEALGYFRTENGMANVYYDGSSLAGFQDLVYVAQCASNQTKYVYEEAISTRYRPVGRSMVGRGVWLTQGNNAIFLIIGGIMLFLLVYFVMKTLRIMGRW